MLLSTISSLPVPRLRKPELTTTSSALAFLSVEKSPPQLKITFACWKDTFITCIKTSETKLIAQLFWIPIQEVFSGHNDVHIVIIKYNQKK